MAPMSTAAPVQPAVLASHARDRFEADPVFRIAARARAAREAGRSIVDASIGVMMRDDGRLWVMDTPERVLHSLPGEEASGYSPFLGTAGFREAVAQLLPAPPGLHQTVIATPGASGAVFLTVYVCLDPGQALLVHRGCWSNYRTIAREHGLSVAWYPYLTEDDRFHVDAMASSAEALLRSQGRTVVVLNAPVHNPTGYCLDESEWRAVAAALRALAARGDPVILLLDVAYLEFSHDPETDRRLLAHFADLPGNVIVAAAWSGSKSYTKYGLRIGALIASSTRSEETQAMESAVNGITRGTWSNVPRPAMLLVERIEANEAQRRALAGEQAEMREALADRERRFSTAADLSRAPYHAGFFTVVRHPDPEAAAQALEARGVFAVPTYRGLRIALSGVPTHQVERLAGELARVCSP